MAKKGTVFIIDDNKSILKTLELLLSEHFQRVITLSSPESFPAMLHEIKSPDVILLDMNFSAGINNGNEGLFWLNRIKTLLPDTPVVLFTAYAYIDLAVAGIKAGAYDFITKPWDNDKLIETLRNARDSRSSGSKRKTKEEPRPVFRGESPAMKKLYEQIEKVARTDANILITGENGTGKEVFAQELHHLSQRSGHDLVTVDMVSITETLFESERFGHVKGAFTDAKSDRAGKFEVASGETLFMDEIGNLPFHLQARLLTALQRRKIIRVGSNTPIDVNIRLICATNCNLPEMVRKGTFREDLYYRINTISLEIPPLRQRREDILPMSEMFIERYAALYQKSPVRLGESAIRKFMEYSWPGNVRELQHTIEKAVIMGDSVLEASDFQFPEENLNVAEAANRTLEEMERDAIANAIRTYDGNLSLVAQQLGITRQTLYNKIKKFNLL